MQTNPDNPPASVSNQDGCAVGRTTGGAVGDREADVAPVHRVPLSHPNDAHTHLLAGTPSRLSLLLLVPVVTAAEKAKEKAEKKAQRLSLVARRLTEKARMQFEKKEAEAKAQRDAEATIAQRAKNNIQNRHEAKLPRWQRPPRWSYYFNSKEDYPNPLRLLRLYEQGVPMKKHNLARARAHKAYSLRNDLQKKLDEAKEQLEKAQDDVKTALNKLGPHCRPFPIID